MNISSVVIKSLPDNLGNVIEALNSIENCEYHQHDERGYIIVTIEGESNNEELEVLKQIQQVENVISAEMVYSYSEEELEVLRANLEKGSQLPTWLNDKNATARDIKYKGDLKKKL